MLNPAGAIGTQLLDGRVVNAKLRFARGGGRTFLQRQTVSYPLHITRPHILDPDQPDFVTLILQSASGGLYRGDRLMLSITAAKSALVHVTSQAATVVHAAAEPGITVATQLEAASGAFLAMSTDPYILFPETTLSVQTAVSLEPGATMVVAEGFTTHDPTGGKRPFTCLSTRFCARDEAGSVLVNEASKVEGISFQGSGSPLGPYRAMGTVMILGKVATRLQTADLEHQLDALNILAGATDLPNRAGICVRLLAYDGGDIARGLDAVVATAIDMAFGRSASIRLR